MIQNNESDGKISLYTGLSIEEIARLRRQQGK